MVNRNEPEEDVVDLQADDQPEQDSGQKIGESTAKKPADGSVTKPSTAPSTVSGIPVQPADTVLPDIAPDAKDEDSTHAKPDVGADAGDSSSDPAVIVHSAGNHRLRHWFGRHKKVVIPVVACVVVLGVLAGLPATRYAIAGTFIKQQYRITLVDSQTGKPVTSAKVSLRGKVAYTDNQGKATLAVPVGKATLTLDKRYYKTTSKEVLIPLKKPAPSTITFVATGRQVPVTILNKLSGKPVANATLSAENTQAITDKNGEVSIVLPADKTTVSGTVSTSNFNKLNVSVKITGSKDVANTFQVVPSGKVYFLSNAAGTLDVVKADLDGQNRQIVLKGTGKEDRSNTVLLAAQNWKYLALLSRRDGGANAKLFLIDTATDALTTMDEGDASFLPIGWSGNTFVYRIDRTNKHDWDAKAQALKSYDAVAKKLNVLDETFGAGTSYADHAVERYEQTYILNNEVVFGKSLGGASMAAMAGHSAGFYTVRPDGTNKKAVKTWASDGTLYVDVAVTPYNPDEVYVASININNDEHLYEYEGGQLKVVDGQQASDIWSQQYFTYLFSPSNKQTFWSEQRDGKNTIFVGDASAGNKKQIATLSEYQTFGWYTDDYLLLSKKGSELYIMPAAGLATGKEPYKMTDYYKPNFSAPGYGKGYGGF